MFDITFFINNKYNINFSFYSIEIIKKKISFLSVQLDDVFMEERSIGFEPLKPDTS